MNYNTAGACSASHTEEWPSCSAGLRILLSEINYNDLSTVWANLLVRTGQPAAKGHDCLIKKGVHRGASELSSRM